MCTTARRLDIQRLGVLPGDPVADATQPGKVAQTLLRVGVLVT